MAQAAAGHMVGQGYGRIIGVTTSMDTMWRKGGAPYGPSKAGHEALVAIMAQDLEGTGVTANVLTPGGATATNMVRPPEGAGAGGLIQPEVMQAPVVWIASDEAAHWNGRRIIAYHWDESLPLEERLEKCGRTRRLASVGLAGRPSRLVRQGLDTRRQPGIHTTIALISGIPTTSCQTRDRSRP